LKANHGDHRAARDFVGAVYRNVPVLDPAARGATTTFAQRGIGDVFLAWENEAFLAQREFPEEGFEIVVPSVSILAEPPVTVVDKNVDRKGTRAVAEAYLKFLYPEEGQDLIGKHFYRPAVSETARANYAARFPAVKLVTVDEVFGGWAKAQPEHFADGGVFDQIYRSLR
jgi:sulfate/thiosulfate-binding protein